VRENSVGPADLPSVTADRTATFGRIGRAPSPDWVPRPQNTAYSIIYGLNDRPAETQALSLAPLLGTRGRQTVQELKRLIEDRTFVAARPTDRKTSLRDDVAPQSRESVEVTPGKARL
jgi:hypothetical protein